MPEQNCEFEKTAGALDLQQLLTKPNGFNGSVIKPSFGMIGFKLRKINRAGWHTSSNRLRHGFEIQTTITLSHSQGLVADDAAVLITRCTRLKEVPV